MPCLVERGHREKSDEQNMMEYVDSRKRERRDIIVKREIERGRDREEKGGEGERRR